MELGFIDKVRELRGQEVVTGKR